MVFVTVASYIGHAATCTVGLNAEYTDGDYLFLNKANLTSVFQISTGTWMRQVDLNSPTYWNQPNAPFDGGYRGSDVDAMFKLNSVIHMIRTTTAYRHDGSRWLSPVDLNNATQWRQPNGPFEGGDTRASTAARALIEAWRVDYHHRQPHSSLSHLTPNEFIAQRQARQRVEEVVCFG